MTVGLLLFLYALSSLWLARTVSRPATERVMSMRVPFVSLLFFAALHTPAFAYLDPGTGSIVLQAIIGAVAVGAATISVYWNKLKALVLGRLRSK